MVLGSAVVLAGCSRDKDKDKSKAAATDKTKSKTAATKKPTKKVKPRVRKERAAPPKKKLAPGLKRPTKEDLGPYTEGLKGSGTLMAKLVTDMGTFHCELYEKQVPMTVANFVGLARGLHPWQDPKTKKIVKKRYYDGLRFHRVIPNFMIQTGDPLGADPRRAGTGGPGYDFDDEFHDELKHDRPARLSMAHPPYPNANGGQFFITEKATPWLDVGRARVPHTIFGQCDNAELVKKISNVPKDPDDRTKSKPKDPVHLKKVTIYRGKPKTE